MGRNALRGKPLRFVTLDSGCFVPAFHKLNQDGYLRVSINGQMKMFHRALWENVNGTIPEGYEVHHTCGVRSCSNIKHLEVISGADHAVLTNEERYLGRKLSIKCSDPSVKAKELAAMVGCSPETVYRHRRINREE